MSLRRSPTLAATWSATLAAVLATLLGAVLAALVTGVPPAALSSVAAAGPPAAAARRVSAGPPPAETAMTVRPARTPSAQTTVALPPADTTPAGATTRLPAAGTSAAGALPDMAIVAQPVATGGPLAAGPVTAAIRHAATAAVARAASIGRSGDTAPSVGSTAALSPATRPGATAGPLDSEWARATDPAPAGRPTAPGGWSPPLPDPLRVTRPFAPPANPYGPGHRGVDLAAAVGTPVRAARAGEITFAGALAGRGVVVVSHGVLRTTYEPVRPAVRRGDQVAGGQLLGWLVGGHPGCPAAACLHWGLLRGATYLDPLSVLRRAQPRLLPLLDAAGGPLP